jgi:DNA-binding response OmpR family regulator
VSASLKVLVIDAGERSLIERADHLLLEGHEVSVAGAEGAARLKLASDLPDIAMFINAGSRPRTLALLREVRTGAVPGADPQVRVVTLGADTDALATVHYKAGSDLALPFTVSPGLLSAAVQTLGDRARGGQEARALRVGSLILDADQRAVRVGDRSVSLTRREFDLLQCLARAPQRTFTKAELARSVWGSDVMARNSRTVDSHVARVRAKLAAAGAPQRVQTVRGVGFRLDR